MTKEKTRTPRLKFDYDNEENVLQALSLYLKDLGYSNLSFQQSFTVCIGKSKHTIKKNERNTLTGRADMLLTVGEIPLAMVETKAPGKALTDNDRDQCLSYARLIKSMPPYSIVTNGETLQAYDTITGELLTQGPIGSRWFQNNKSFAGLSSADSGWAARVLLRLNFLLLKEFCNQQVQRTLDDLKGSSVDRNRRYITDLYVAREAVSNTLIEFEASDYLCFTLVGEPGIGKTNEMCFFAETLCSRKTDLVLFFKVDKLDGLFSAIGKEFEWEFGQEYSAPRIARVLKELQTEKTTKLHVLFDGLDEFTEGRDRIRRELLELCEHLNAENFKLYLSCKTSEWDVFIKDKGESLNILGRITFPLNSKPGFTLSRMNDCELQEAWQKYSLFYGLQGELLGETKRESSLPFHMRLIAETFEKSSMNIPQNIDCYELYNHYFSRKIAQCQCIEGKVEAICSALAEYFIDNDMQSARINDFLRGRTNIHIEDLNILVKTGLIGQSDSGSDIKVSFVFGRMLLYIFVDVARNWRNLTDKNKIINDMKFLIDRRLGMEAIGFYISVCASLDSTLLSELNFTDFRQFTSLIRSIPIPSITPSRSPTDGVERIKAFLTRYAVAYDYILAHLGSLKFLIEPFSNGNVGVWGGFDGKKVHFGLRTKSTEYPEILTWLDDEMLKKLITDSLSPQEQVALCIARRISIWPPTFDTDFFPEGKALKEICKQLTDLHKARSWDESYNPEMAVERYLHLIEHEPCLKLYEMGDYYECLGFRSVEEAMEATNLQLAWRGRAVLNQAPKDTEHPDLLIRYLHYGIDLIGLIAYPLEFPTMKPDEWKKYRCHHDWPSEEELSSMVTFVVDGLGRFMERNLGQLANCFETFKRRNNFLLVELSESDLGNRFLTFVWCPSLLRDYDHIILKKVLHGESCGEKFIINQKSAGNIMQTGVQIQFNHKGILYNENDALISRISLSRCHSISYQIYQLVANEAQYFLYDNIMDWWWAGVSQGFSPLKPPLPVILEMYRQQLNTMMHISSGRDRYKCPCGSKRWLHVQFIRSEPVSLSSSWKDEPAQIECPSCGEKKGLTEYKKKMETLSGYRTVLIWE